MNVKYVGPARDYSGYGEANRHDIGALVAAGVSVTTRLPSFSLEISEFGRLGDLAGRLEGNPIPYEIVMLHITPNIYRQYMEAGKYHIGRVFWETNRIPLDFAPNVQLLDEIWTGSEYNAQAIRNAGVTKPIYIIPEAIDTEVPENLEPYKVLNQDDFKFYSIFEWTERKNPTALLTAFWQEFEETEGVSLTIKTYVDNFTPERRNEINQYIRLIKKRLQLKRYAPVYLYKNLMDRQQIYRFHKTFDCFVSTHRGEGWGIPQMEAMLLDKPVITTNCGGVHEYLTDRKDALLLPCRLVPLVENNRNKQWYTPDQQWAEVEVPDVRKVLRWVFENQQEARRIGDYGHRTIKELFSLRAVGNKMAERLKVIEETILRKK